MSRLHSRFRLLAAAVALPGLALPGLAVLASPSSTASQPASGAARTTSVSGPAAVTALGERLDEVAAANGWTAAHLRRVLRTDPTAWVDPTDRVLYREPTSLDLGQAQAGPRAEAAPYPLDQTFVLHSRPASTHTIYLDFDGVSVSGTAWNAAPDNLPSGTFAGWSTDGSPGFSDAERTQIQSVWQRVAEDYAAFDVDVTTEDPGAAGIDRTNVDDVEFGTRAVITSSSTVSGALCGDQCGGVAYLGAFDLTGASHPYYQPAWIFGHLLANDTKNIAEAVSHEVGHNFGLDHDGTASTGYYTGQGLWAPIMGVGYSKPLSQWSKGEYTGANNSENDLAVIAANGAPVVADEAGGTVGTAASAIPATGYITSAGDLDIYALGTCSGAVTVAVTGAPVSQDLDLRLELLDAAGSLIAADDQPSAMLGRDSASGLNASVTATVAEGAYYARVDGVGNGGGASGYSDYASIGAYTLSSSCGGGGTPATAPSAPTGLTVTANGSSITASWSAPDSNGGSPVTSYAVQRSGGASETTTATTRSWTGLTPGTTYTVTVAATNVAGTGPSTSKSASLAGVPTVPTSLTITPTTNGQAATITWAAPASDGGSAITSYRLTRTGGGGVTVSPSTTSYEWSGLTASSTYTFSVTANNAVGTGPSAMIEATMPAGPGGGTTGGATTTSAPDAPRNLVAKAGKKGGKKTASVRWTAPTGPLTGFRVQILSARTGATVKVVEVSASTLTYTAKLKAGGYRFVVIALNGTGASVPSAPSKAVKAL